MSLVQHICKFFCLGCYVQNLFFHLLAFILWYQHILCFFDAFQFYARISHPVKKVPLEKSGSLFLGCVHERIHYSVLIFFRVTFLLSLLKAVARDTPVDLEI